MNYDDDDIFMFYISKQKLMLPMKAIKELHSFFYEMDANEFLELPSFTHTLSFAIGQVMNHETVDGFDELDELADEFKYTCAAYQVSKVNKRGVHVPVDINDSDNNFLDELKMA